MRRTEAEIRDLVAGYDGGNQTRAAYCADHGLTVAALDFYRRRVRRSGTKLVKVDVTGTWSRMAAPGAVSVVLANGRRLESAWSDLLRLGAHTGELQRLLRCVEEA
ncbi:MAG: hypothetical protein HYX68_04740 [Planctomycetes bacterium]|nr:hypothetical protein [Planctomycetota bacterium]